MNLPPKVALSKLVNSLTSVSSQRMRQEFPGLRRHHWRGEPGVVRFARRRVVGGAPISVLRQYIEQQNQPG